MARNKKHEEGKKKVRRIKRRQKKVILIGQRHRFEIWSEGNWNQGRENWLADTSGDLDVPEEMQSISL